MQTGKYHFVLIVDTTTRMSKYVEVRDAATQGLPSLRDIEGCMIRCRKEQMGITQMQ